ncbi:MAG: hypothetical protein NC310_00330 [Roseburia sp.]|nr:hypothetical protein [Anaeroplasma bactoclasticum]MCM1195499.1 hypothetical protein [Roseburia sp.]MCM1556877.1 hypothetical protein [Anaeroplasma bactoclasticum]
MKITSGFEETAYLSPSIREYLKHRETTFAEDDSFFLRIAPVDKQVAIRNNYEAYRFAIGNVPDLHRKMLNPKTIPTIHKKLLAKIVNNVSIEGEKDDDIKIIKAAIKAFPKKIKQAVSATLLRGEALLAIDLQTSDKEGKSKIVIQTYPLARYDIIVNTVDEIIDAKLYKQLIDGSTKYVKYVLAEHRYLKKGTYYSEVIITKYESTAMKAETDKLEAYQLKEEDIPDNIKKILGDVKINKPKEIPCLGVYRLSNTDDNLLCPNSGISESQYIDIADEVISHDTSFTYREMDKNIGRGRVITPFIGKIADSRISQRIDVDGTSVRRVVPTTMLDYTFMTPYENLAADKAIPQNIQFNLRTAEWVADMSCSISRICTKCGLSVYDFDPTLFGGVRTAREIDELSDLTKATVKEKHNAFTDTINEMLSDCALLLGYEQISIFVKWDKSTTENAAANNEIVIARYNARLCSQKTAIKNLNPNWKDEEVEAEIERIDAETDGQDANTLFGAI